MDNILLFQVLYKDLLADLGALIEEKLRAASAGQQEKLLSPAEACKLFEPAISKVTLSKWTNDGLIPLQKIGGRVFYKHTDIIEAGTKLKRYHATRPPLSEKWGGQKRAVATLSDTYVNQVLTKKMKGVTPADIPSEVTELQRNILKIKRSK